MKELIVKMSDQDISWAFSGLRSNLISKNSPLWNNASSWISRRHLYDTSHISVRIISIYREKTTDSNPREKILNATGTIVFYSDDKKLTFRSDELNITILALTCAHVVVLEIVDNEVVYELDEILIGKVSEISYEFAKYLDMLDKLFERVVEVERDELNDLALLKVVDFDRDPWYRYTGVPKTEPEQRVFLVGHPSTEYIICEDNEPPHVCTDIIPDVFEESEDGKLQVVVYGSLNEECHNAQTIGGMNGSPCFGVGLEIDSKKICFLGIHKGNSTEKKIITAAVIRKFLDNSSLMQTLSSKFDLQNVLRLIIKDD